MSGKVSRRPGETRSSKGPATPSRTGSKARETRRSGSAKPQTVGVKTCDNCEAPFKGEQTALFVEEEVGRVFCSESCITEYFVPEISKLEKFIHKSSQPGDLIPTQNNKLADLRWVTIREPEEIWCQTVASGDRRYALISSFEVADEDGRPGGSKIWSVCLCLCLKGEPSFLFQSFVTRSERLVDKFRKGTQQATQQKKKKLLKLDQKKPRKSKAPTREVIASPVSSWDSALAYQNPEDEYRSLLMKERSADDIAPEEFAKYQHCIDETLQGPDEVWSQRVKPTPEILRRYAGSSLDLAEDLTNESTEESEAGRSAEEAAEALEEAKEQYPLFYHFMKYYSEELTGVWFVVVAKETDDEEHIEILECFPTRDPALVEKYRKGKQEVGDQTVTSAAARFIH